MKNFNVMKPEIARITVYPIKGLDGADLRSAGITGGGSLKHDRRFALQRPDGKFINGKRTPLVFKLRTYFNPELSAVSFKSGEIESPQFELRSENRELHDWLSDYFGIDITVVENIQSGFPDDTEASGPTIVSAESYAAVSEWFDNMDTEIIHRRFRPNIVIKDCAPFWEDTLFAGAGEERSFYAGKVQFYGINPCARCIVPTTDPYTGERIDDFQKKFMERREASLPEGVAVERFDHYYRLSVNTRIPASEAGKVLSAGDKIIINSYV